MSKIEFAMMDCKEGGPVQVRGINGPPNDRANCLAVAECEKEFLERLDALQKEMAAKYGPRIDMQREKLALEAAGDDDALDEMHDEVEEQVWGKTNQYSKYGHLLYH